jgi:DNA-binding MarR family transcriptional regulator
VPKASRELDLELCAKVAETCTASHLRRASRAVSNAFDETLRPLGLRASQLDVLVALALAGEVSVTKLAEILALDRTTLTRNLGPLERRGLVASAAAADRRNRLLGLTDGGRGLLARALPSWQRAQALVVRDLGEARWKGLLRALEATTSAARGR